MSDTYLNTSFKDREQVKALGARWDPVQKKWFVPTGRDLAPFATWLPAEFRSTNLDLRTGSLATSALPSATDVTLANKGIPLSQLLAGVAQAVAQAYRAGVWIRSRCSRSMSATATCTWNSPSAMPAVARSRRRAP